MEMLHAQADLIESMQNFLKKYDHIPHNEKSIKLLLAEEKFLKIKQVVEEEQFQPEYLKHCLQSLLTDYNSNEFRPLKQETLTKSDTIKNEKKNADLLAEEEGGEIDLDISKIVDISLREKLVGSYLLIEKINAFSLSPPISGFIPLIPFFSSYSGFPSILIISSITNDNRCLSHGGIESDRDSGEDTTSIDDLPLDDSIIFPEYESFTFDDEPVMAEVNVFDEINTSELSYPGIGENVVSDEEEDTFTFTTRTFLPFVTYPEVFRILDSLLGSYVESHLRVVLCVRVALYVRVVLCVRVALRVRVALLALRVGVALHVRVVLCVRVSLHVGVALHVRVVLCIRVALRVGVALRVRVVLCV
ncbi:hypothetical protein Tco_0210931 [Tanacetum coccineum]